MKRRHLLPWLIGPSAWAQSDAPVLSEPPAYRRGQTWTYRRTDRMDASVDEEYLMEYVGSNEALRTDRFRCTMLKSAKPSEEGRRWMIHRDRDGHSDTIFPDKTQVVWMQFPLQAGKRWRYDSSFTTRSQQILSEAGTVEVLGQERIETPAGVFEAWRLDLSAAWRDQGSGYEVFGSLQRRLWYAPQALAFVRHEFDHRLSRGLSPVQERSTRVLVAYSV